MNLNAAYKQVRQNKGSGGVDRMDVGSLKDYLVRAKEELTASIERGKYRPNPVRRAEIPKGNRKRRELDIPTVVVRVIQQGIAQQLSLLYDPGFSPHSFGFRPKRSAHQALGKCRDYIREGYVYAVDIDLERFFDTVNHSKLTEELSRKIKDGRVISFIHYIKGWLPCFRLAYMETLLSEIDEWYGRRLRMVIWKQWKQAKTRRRNLEGLGVIKSKAHQWAYTRKSYWHTAGNYILSTTITTQRLRLAGYVFFTDFCSRIRVVS